MKKLGWFTGDQRTTAEIAADQVEADKQKMLADLALRAELIDKLMGTVQQTNNARVTRMDDVSFEQSREQHRKWLNTLPTENLQQRVQNMEGAAKLRSLSHDDLKKAAREGQTANTIATAASVRRESPDFALPNTPEYSAEALKKMPRAEFRKLCFHDNGQPRYVRQGSPITMLQACNDRARGLA